MIVAYVSPTDSAKRAQLLDVAQSEPVTFRDPETFTAADADPLDRVVYVAQDAEAIRQVYEGFPNATLYNLDASVLDVPVALGGVAARRRQAARAGQLIDGAAVPNVHPPDLTNPALDPGTPVVSENHLEGIKRVDATPVIRERSGRFALRRADAMQAEAPILTDDEAAAGVTVEAATAGVFRPNSSAILQHTEPEPAPVATLQKPHTEPPQTRPRSAPGQRREERRERGASPRGMLQAPGDTSGRQDQQGSLQTAARGASPAPGPAVTTATPSAARAPEAPSLTPSDVPKAPTTETPKP